MFDEATKLVLGLLTGMVFGFLLQKGRAAKFQVIIGQFLLKDWTVVKIMGTAVIVGSVGVYVLVLLDFASLHVKPFLLGGVVLGAVFFGIGMAVFGYCPGTSVAACGEGRRDAIVGVLGMLAGAGIYVSMFPMLQPFIKGLGDAGEITLPQVTGTSTGPWIAGLAAVGTLAFLVFERKWRWDSPLQRDSNTKKLRIPPA